MAYFQLGDKQFPLKTGSQRVGPDGTGADLVLPSGPASATAVVVVNADQSVIIQRGTPESVVKVNRVLLGAEPSPLIHGDHVELGGHDLRFGDMAQAGSTQFVSGADIAAIAKARQGLSPVKPTTATGGHLVSHVDGREYTIPPGGLTIGRDPSVEVVVPKTEVSRKHVHIAPAEQGYLLTDLSANGVWVNDTRVTEKQILGRGDLIKVGGEEFRFYADAVKAPTAAPVPPPAPAPPAPAPVTTPLAAAAPPTPAPAPPPVAAAALPAPVAPLAVPPPALEPPRPIPPSTPVAAVPVQPPAPAPAKPAALRPALARLEVLNDGPEKGKRLDVHGPLTHIGRGEHNDLVLANASISDSHAKLQRREAGWFIVDIDSTNGTYVGGRRVHGEQALTGAPDLRFGDVKVAFRPSAETIDEGKSTRAIVGLSFSEAKRQAERRSTGGVSHSALPVPPSETARPSAVPSKPAPTPTSGRTPAWLWVVAVLVVIVALARIFFFRGA